jgi:signal transduction histidine kinase
MGDVAPSEKLAVLGRAARLLASATDFDATLANTISACLPALGDFGFFDVLVDGTAEHGTVRRASAAFEDPRVETILAPTQWVRSERTDMNLCALSHGEAALHPAIDDAWYRAIAVNEGHLAVLRDLAFHSMLTVPMRYRDELVGALTLFFGRSKRSHTEDMRAFAEDLAALAVPVVVTARLAERLRRSEERVRLAADAGGLGLWDWDVVANRVEWSDRVYDLYAIPRGSFGGRLEDFSNLVHPDDAARVQSAIEQSLAEGDDYSVEFRAVRPDGTIRWFTTQAHIYRDADGKPLRMLGATYDITERVELLAATEHARAEAEAANRAKDEFLAILGHELRNPLAPIVSALELMRLRGDASSLREREVIERQVAHVSRLVDDLLDVARIVRGRVDLTPQPTSVRAIVEKTIEMTRPLYTQRGVALHVGSLPDCWVNGDPVRLAQAVSNVLTNAAKFTPRGGRVDVELHTNESEIEIVVRDTGIGIERELLPTIFGLFVQGPQPLDRREGGLGLGLAIVGNLIERHGGTVVAESDGPGTGSTFRIRLPCIRAPHTAATAGAIAPAPAHTARVLVVDDNSDAAELLADLLRVRGYDVVVEGTAPGALRTAATMRPDLAILDIGLPDMNGFELARALRANANLPNLRLVALTGYGRSADREASRDAGFDEHLVKPVAPTVLFETVEQLLTARV